MNSWSEYKKIFSETSLEEVYKNHIILGGATGIDKVTHETFMSDKKKQISIISKKVISGIYKFTKYKLKLINKGRKQCPREISIPTIRDRVVLRGLCDYLNIVFKQDIDFDLPQNVVKKVKGALENGKYSSFIKLGLPTN